MHKQKLRLSKEILKCFAFFSKHASLLLAIVEERFNIFSILYVESEWKRDTYFTDLHLALHLLPSSVSNTNTITFIGLFLREFANLSQCSAELMKFLFFCFITLIFTNLNTPCFETKFFLSSNFDGRVQSSDLFALSSILFWILLQRCNYRSATIFWPWRKLSTLHTFASFSILSGVCL